MQYINYQFGYIKKRWLLIGASLLVVIIFFLLKQDDDILSDIEVQTVTRGEVLKTVSETGFVQPAREVALAFELGGKVSSVPVAIGETVAAGDSLVTLDSVEKKIELSAAYARLRAEQLRLDELISGADTVSLGVTQSIVESARTTFQNAQDQLDTVTQQQNQLVENARQTLLTSDLTAYFTGGTYESPSYSYEPPSISGRYEGAEEGEYVIDLYKSSSPSGYSFRYSGLESGVDSVSTERPVLLGTEGLYIQFPDNFARGAGVEWEVPVPNTRSSQYVTNLNAYNAALQARDVAIQVAQNNVNSAEAALYQVEQQYLQASSPARDERVEAQRALVQQVLTTVQSAENTVNKMTLRAPFMGLITDIYIEEGEIISPATPAINLISDENYELVVYVSESDIQEVEVGDSSVVMFDAYRDSVFNATVSRVAPSAEMVDGVRVIEIVLSFEEKDERIRTGLSADIEILAAVKHDVISVPTRAVVELNTGNFVRVLTSEGRIRYVPVKTGLRGSDGMVEITEGLTEGQEIITFAREDVIDKLEIENHEPI